MNAPRPGDRYYLDVTYADGKVTRFTIDALDDRSAFYETAYVLGDCGDIHVPVSAVSGVLYRTGGDVVAQGDLDRFEELAS